MKKILFATMLATLVAFTAISCASTQASEEALAQAYQDGYDAALIDAATGVSKPIDMEYIKCMSSGRNLTVCRDEWFIREFGLK